ncbi:ral-GDS-related protein-like [Manis pentadactyla]|uniref:ral-GDS-related protein-like n=1 Tax=Manis pentadactyla TaxID=143292 RepID=UPI00255CF78C|nr:ral-GDS-related protein-like [Manis pentadactyla]
MCPVTSMAASLHPPWDPRWQSWKGISPGVTFSLCPAPDLWQRRLAPETKGRPASWLQLVQALLQTPVRELRPASPASAPAEPEDIPAEASALRQGPKLEPQEPSGLVRRATAVMVPGLAEPEPCPDPMSPWDIPGVVSAPVPGPELEPHEPPGLGPVAPAGMAPGLAEPEADLEPTSACVAITRDVPRTKERTILQFPAHLVAKQLTLMCAELYSRIEYGECKAYLDSQPLTEGTELLAPNVQMVIRQFDAMVSLVISSCLGTVTMTAQDRAQVVQFWIRVAEECLALKNFAALHAILLALQSRPIGRLESTWGRVSWKSSRTYKKLKKRDEEANREWFLKVNGGQRSGREGSSGQVLCHAVAQLWGRLEVCGVRGGS